MNAIPSLFDVPVYQTVLALVKKAESVTICGDASECWRGVYRPVFEAYNMYISQITSRFSRLF